MGQGGSDQNLKLLCNLKHTHFSKNPEDIQRNSHTILIQEQKQVKEFVFQSVQKLDLADKDFKKIAQVCSKTKENHRDNKQKLQNIIVTVMKNFHKRA